MQPILFLIILFGRIGTEEIKFRAFIVDVHDDVGLRLSAGKTLKVFQMLIMILC